MNSETKSIKNKLYIKILFTLVLLLVLIGIGNKVQADVQEHTINRGQFDADPTMFCLNYNYPMPAQYGEIKYYKVYEFSVTNGIRTVTINEAAPTDQNEKNFFNNYQIVSYLLSNSKSSRTQMSDDPVQWAIWDLSVSNIGYSSGQNSEANKLLASANAYKSFYEAGYIDYQAKVVIDSSNPPKIVSTQGSDSIIGPFSIDYKYTTGTSGGQTGYYGEITAIQFNGSDAKSYICNESGGAYDGNSTLIGTEFKDPAPGKPFYLKVPTSSIQSSNNITVTLNNNYRDITSAAIYQAVGEINNLKPQSILKGSGKTSNRSYPGDFTLDTSKKPTIVITKTNSKTGAAVAGAAFKMTITNVKAIKGYSFTGTTPTLTVTTDSSGKITLSEVELSDANANVVITLEETTAPTGYQKISRKNNYNIEKEWR